MGWLEDLYITYECNKEQVGNFNEKAILFPIAHSSQNAQVEVVLGMDGSFRRAEMVDKADAVTLIPATDKSAARANGITPHPLCDKLIYVAGDYKDFSSKKKVEDFHHAYMENLTSWHNSNYTHPKVDAIYTYLKKGILMRDLISQDILKIDENHQLLTTVKNQNIVQSDFFIRFRVVNDDIENTDITETWKDSSLFDSFINYYCNKQGSLDLCYITGMEMSCSTNHPSKIRHSGDKAKLISANDTSNFTFRGRTSNAERLLSIGYETSQKAHNALRWLLQRQGYKGLYSVKKTNTGESEYKQSTVRNIVAWELHNLPTPAPTDSSDEVIEESSSFEEQFNASEDSFYPKTQPEYGKRIARAIEGYKKHHESLKTTPEVVVMAVDAATTGRLSVTYYQKIMGSSLLAQMQNWFETCSWEFTGKNKKGETITYIRTPSLSQIATSAFGTEQGAFIKIGNDALLRNQIERLIPCITDGKNIPQDILQAVINRASTPLAYEFYNWRTILSVACALIKKDRNNRFQENWTEELDTSNSDPNYLFGRLLAVADWAEMRTYTPGETRETNAKQLFFMFSKRPQHTWYLLSQKLQIYLSKMPKGLRNYFENTLGDISLGFSNESFSSVSSLNELFFLGYSHQRSFFQRGIEKRKKNEKNNDFFKDFSDSSYNISIEDEDLEKSVPQQKTSFPEQWNSDSFDRSYLFGKLLAIADYLEDCSVKNNDRKETLAKHYFSSYINRPASTWVYLLGKLQPYFSKLETVSDELYFGYMLEKIYSQFTQEIDASSNIKLDDTFILGFYQQKRLLKQGRDKSYYRPKDWNVYLDEENHNPNYLFGRLLAVADWVELLTFDSDEKRDTNTRRYFSVFPREPHKNWEILKGKAKQYLQKLQKSKNIQNHPSVFCEKISEIESTFLPGEFEKNEKLTPLYLQGYFHQKHQLRKKYWKKTKKHEKKENEL